MVRLLLGDAVDWGRGSRLLSQATATDLGTQPAWDEATGERFGYVLSPLPNAACAATAPRPSRCRQLACAARRPLPCRFPRPTLAMVSPNTCAHSRLLLLGRYTPQELAVTHQQRLIVALVRTCA